MCSVHIARLNCGHASYAVSLHAARLGSARRPQRAWGGGGRSNRCPPPRCLTAVGGDTLGGGGGGTRQAGVAGTFAAYPLHTHDCGRAGGGGRVGRRGGRVGRWGVPVGRWARLAHCRCVPRRRS
eukprot:scaffold16383_cov59-Phaeocystis_antarctica.AAC.1